MKTVNIRLKNLQHWLLPGNCPLCAARAPRGRDLCPDCERSLPYLSAVCRRCAAPFHHPEASGGHCGRCQKQPPAFARAEAAFEYAPPVSQLIQDLKYHRQLYNARILGQYLAAHLETRNHQLPDVMVPVPLHPARLRERGYNQALELARPLARRLQLPLKPGAVRRIRATPPQTQLPRKLREKNVRGVFRVDTDVERLRVAIVDDVMTSGHTVNALAACLRKAGAAEVVVWVVARA